MEREWMTEDGRYFQIWLIPTKRMNRSEFIAKYPVKGSASECGDASKKQSAAQQGIKRSRDDQVDNQVDDQVNLKRAKKLWSWYRQIDMQTMSHLGDAQTDACWKELSTVKSAKHLLANQRMFDLMSTLQFQYREGFTGKADRV